MLLPILSGMFSDYRHGSHTTFSIHLHTCVWGFLHMGVGKAPVYISGLSVSRLREGFQDTTKGLSIPNVSRLSLLLGALCLGPKAHREPYAPKTNHESINNTDDRWKQRQPQG